MPTEEPAYVLLVNGPAGVGKTTFASRWAETRKRRTAVLDHDMIRWNIRAGFEHPINYSAEAARQWQLGIDLCCLMARRYARDDIDTVISAYEPGPLKPWVQRLAPTEVRAVYLLPPLEVALTRNRNRETALPDEAVIRNFDEFAVDETLEKRLVVDNSDMSVDATVQAVDQWLAWTPSA
jgi:adenylylsulfate kinase-like enzyme